MRRFNYVKTPLERLFGYAMPSTLPRAYRAPLSALLCVIVIAGFGYGVQESRQRQAVLEANASAKRLAALEVDGARVRVLANEVARLGALVRHIDEIRNSGDTRANQLATLGNNVPPDAWLTSIHLDQRVLGIEGRARRLDTVGKTMTALSRLPAYGIARLLNVHGEPPRPGVTYALVLEPTR